MEIQLLMLPISLLTLCSFILAVASSPSLAKPNCPTHCGSIEIPFPFGIGQGCYSENNSYDIQGFEIVCDNSTNPPKPFLNLSNTSRMEVLDISLSGTLRIYSPIFFSDCPNKRNHSPFPNLTQSPFTLSENNKFTAVSCGRIASLQTLSDGTKVAVCLSICDDVIPVMGNNICGGINCCQASIRSNLPITVNPSTFEGPPIYDDSLSVYLMMLNISFESLKNDAYNDEPTCKYAFLVDPEWIASNSTDTAAIADMGYVPILLDWITSRRTGGSSEYSINKSCNDIERGRQCFCAKGYQGNPYIDGGCQDIDECKDPHRPGLCHSGYCFNTPGDYVCRSNPPQPITLINAVLCSIFGPIFLTIGTWWLHKVIKKRKDKRRRKKYYTQNGGLLLEKLLSSDEVNIKINLFDDKVLEKATDWYNEDRVVGEGGQGTVYKGMLTDGRIVAAKKSKIIDGGDVSQFINEIFILSQINHRNVVKILGRCLESEVPILIYEFLPNGTLSQYIHSRYEDFVVTWEMRIRVGIEVATALSYLHSFASTPIYHRDIKSSNILLDEKYKAKIADFGISRNSSVDKTHLTMTHVNGTFGYLDPEYFHSSQFTDKSDVYSFGVVLAELLTGQKPVHVTRLEDGTQEGRSLAVYFTASMEENFLFDILDSEVIKGEKDEIMTVANLTKRCLNVKGKKRPTMKEVATELEAVLISNRSSKDVGHVVAVEYPPTECTESLETSDASFTSIGPHLESGSFKSF